MSVTLEFNQQFRVTEIVVDAFTDTAADTIRKELESLLELDADTTPDFEDYAIFALTMSSGTGSIDLTALPHLQTGYTITKSATAKKIRALLFKTASNNTANVTIAKGAATGYAPLGSTYSRILAPDTVESQGFKSAALTVDSSNKIFDVTGTGAEIVYVAVAWG